MWGDTLIYTVNGWEQGIALAIYDPQADTVEYVPLWQDNIYPTELYLQGDQLLAVGEDGRVALVSLVQQNAVALEETVIPEGLYPYPTGGLER